MTEPTPPRPLTVREAGRKGGTTTAQRHGREHYERIGALGGQRVRELVDRAKAQERSERD